MLSIQGVSEDAAGLVAGLTIGVRDGISEAAAEQMRTLSLTHLVAVSGANLAIVLASVYFLAAAMGLARVWRFSLGLFAMAGYVLLVGPESSVIRAATMATFVMAGLWLGRGSSALNSLALAVIFLLATDPALSRDIGFALSAFATAGLLVLAPPLFERLRGSIPEVLALGIAASAAAQLFTTPVLLILQPSLPLYSILANVLVEPVVAPITILGILSVLISLLSIPLASTITYVASLLASWIITIAEKLSVLPEARLHFVSGLPGIALAAAIVLLIALSVSAMKHHASVLRGMATILTLFALSWSLSDRIRFETFAGDWDVVACDVGQGDALLVRSAGVVAMIDVGPEPEPIDRCLSNLNVDRIDLLVLTHYDKDHVGGIRGALAGRSVSQVLLSGFDDERPLVSVVAEALSENSVSPMVARSGMTGRFGNGTWSVISPSGDENQAADANDASVIFAVEVEGWAVLGLGDLGESAQLQLLSSRMPALDSLSRKTLVLKVAHHGSADQSAELAKRLSPEYAIFSVGKNNYGHPTTRALSIYEKLGSQILRTDKLGPVALRLSEQSGVFTGGKLSG